MTLPQTGIICDLLIQVIETQQALFFNLLSPPAGDGSDFFNKNDGHVSKVCFFLLVRAPVRRLVLTLLIQTITNNQQIYFLKMFKAPWQDTSLTCVIKVIYSYQTSGFLLIKRLYNIRTCVFFFSYPWQGTFSILFFNGARSARISFFLIY